MTAPTTYPSRRKGRNSMWPRLSAVLGFAAVAIVLAIAPAAAGQSSQQLEMYTLRGNPEKIARATEGVELAGVQRTASGITAGAVLTPEQRAKVAASGRGQADAQPEGPDRHPAGRTPSGRRLQRLPVLGRAGRHPRRALPARAPQPEARKARGPRRDVPGSRADRAEGDEGATRNRRIATGGSRTRRTSTRASGSASR